MIPNIDILTEEITENTYPSRTYKINFAEDMKNSHSLGLTHKDELQIESNDRLSTFTLTSDGVLSISYNTTIAGYNLTTDPQGVLGLTMSADLVGKDRISGFIDDLDALTQAIYLILSTERYQFLIYSWDYGVELLDLYGQPMPYVMAELPRRINDALTQDDRIEDVVDFEFEQNGKILSTKFTIVSNLGSISTVLEVGV